MLELLSTGLSNNSKGEVPWPGIRLTLRQAREAVLGARETVAVESAHAVEAPVSRERVESERRRNSSIADRILQVSPQEGRVRELVDNSNGRTISEMKMSPHNREKLANSR